MLRNAFPKRRASLCLPQLEQARPGRVHHVGGLLPTAWLGQDDNSSHNNNNNNNHKRISFKKYFSTTTYYDSQSGMHVPIHNENDVSAFLSMHNKDSTTASSSADLQSLIETNRLQGGVLLPPPRTILVGDPTPKVAELMMKKIDFELLVPHSLTLVDDGSNKKIDDGNNDKLTLLFEYDSLDSGGGDILTQEILSCAEQQQQSITTAILCRCGDDDDAVGLANGVAQVLDDTTTTAANKYLYVLGEDADSVVEVCEELSYVDAPGPTMKSRIIVDLTTQATGDGEETLEECLMMGVNKFAIADKNQLSWLGETVEEQGKNCTFLF